MSSTTTTTTDLMLGFAAAIGSIVLFGCCLIPLKFKSVTRVKLHPLVFNMYMTSGVCLGCLIILIVSHPYVFTWMAVLSAALWTSANAAACVAVFYVGLSLGSGL